MGDGWFHAKFSLDSQSAREFDMNYGILLEISHSYRDYKVTFKLTPHIRQQKVMTVITVNPINTPIVLA